MEEIKRFPVICPVCDERLTVGKLYCSGCHTEVSGSFVLPQLARLNEKEQQFALDFLKSGGSLKEMARSMGLSYPTVRNLLDDLIEKLTKMN